MRIGKRLSCMLFVGVICCGAAVALADKDEPSKGRRRAKSVAKRIRGELITRTFTMGYDQPGVIKVVSGLYPDCSVGFLRESHMIVVRGTKQDLEEIEAVLTELIGASSKVSAVAPVVLALEHAYADDIGALIHRISRDDAAPKNWGQFAVFVDKRTNSLVLTGDESTIQRVVAFVKELDLPVAAHE